MVGVAGKDDARADRDLGSGDGVGIAAAVPALVLVADDPRDHAHSGDRSQDALADHRVLSHDLPLGVVERAGLVQDRVGNANLADVVKQRGDPRGTTRSQSSTDASAATARLPSLPPPAQAPRRGDAR